MTFSLSRFILAVLIAVVVGFVLVVFLGPILDTLKAPIATTVGSALENYGWAIGVIVGLWYYFTNGTWRLG